MKCAIWDDEDYRSLTMEAQWLYEAILTQKDLSLCGVLTWTPKRFSKLAANASTSATKKALDLLRSRLYVVLDDDTDELWVRTLIINDGVLDNANSIIGMSNAFGAIHSQALRHAVVEGLGEGFLEGLPDRFPKGLPYGFHDRLGKGFVDALALTGARAPGPAPVPPASCLLPPASRLADKPPGPKPATAKRFDPEARSLVDEWWESQDPRPPNKYWAVVTVVQQMLSSGVERQALRRALDEAPTPSVPALQVALSRQHGGTTHNGNILTERDGPTIAYIPEDWK